MITAEIFGPDLLIVVIVAALVLFGGTRLPKLARSLGSAQSEFKKGIAEGAAKEDVATSEATASAATDTASSDITSAPATSEDTATS
jgi:sec-independent protein translocase protein TatA